jgi:hypothetical protein
VDRSKQGGSLASLTSTLSRELDTLDVCLGLGLAVLIVGVWLAYDVGHALIVLGSVLTLTGLIALGRRIA